MLPWVYTAIGTFSKPRQRRRRRRQQGRGITKDLMSGTIAQHLRFKTVNISKPSSAK